MKKRMLLLFIMAGMLVAGCENTETEEVSESQISGDTEDYEEVQENTEDVEMDVKENEADVKEAAKKETLSFSELENLEFYFASGAGAWRTVLTIDEDGDFSGVYSDSDMGSNGPENPYGVIYYCAFEGRFTQPVKVNDYTYSMQIEEINYENESDTEEIKDGFLYYYSTPYGLDGADEILIYLPGAPFMELPEEYRNWVRGDMTDPETLDLPFYGLYNVKEQNGFSSYDISNRITDMIAATEEWSITVKASLENDPLTQADLNEKSKELYDIWDSALNNLWDSLKKTLPEEEMSALLAEQRGWIAEKEQAVEEAGEEVAGGSMQSMVMNLKAAEMTEERVYELLELLE